MVPHGHRYLSRGRMDGDDAGGGGVCHRSHPHRSDLEEWDAGNDPRPAPPGRGSDERNPLCPKENDPVTTTAA